MEADVARDSLKIALIVSLAFNIAVVGAFAYGFARRPSPEHFGPPPGCLPGEPFSGRVHMFARQIGMPGERAARFSHMMADTSGGMADLRVKLQKARGELIELMSAPQPDEKAILAKVDEVSALQGHLERGLVERLLRVSATLDPQEREKFIRAIRLRCGACDPGVHQGPGRGREESEVGG
jgi:Spy/CpxP family protein refolding chaperone